MTECPVESSAEVVVDLNEKKPIRVLHVDDEPSFLKMAKQCLEMQGPFQVDTASSVEEALGKMKKETYDALVSDYQMPGKDGLELLKELRQSGNTIPFVIFTGKGKEEVAIRALNLGADQYLQKTGDPETVYCELEHAIRRTVERKKAETALETCGERYGRLFNSAVEGILINGSDGRISSVNPAVAKILGYSSPKELIGKPAVELYADPDSRALLLKELMEKGYVKEHELTWRKKDGTLIEILASAIVQKDEKGNMLRTEEIIRDITEKKKAEEALRESEEKLRSLFDATVDGIAYVDTSGKILAANKRLVEGMLGYRMDETIGMNFMQMGRVDPKELPMVLKAMEEVAATGKSVRSLEVTLIGRDGGRIPTEINTSVLKKGDKVAGIITVIRDITERKKAEDALRESEEKYKDLFENAIDVILTLDLKGSVTAANSSILRFGYKKEDLVGKSILDFVSKEYWPTVMKDFSEVTQGETARNETEIVAPTGKILVEYNARAIVKENNVTGLQINLRDVTERKKVEEAVRSSEAKLRAILSSSPEAISVSDLNAKLIDCNEAFLKLHGYLSREELIGTSWFDVVAPANRFKIQDTMGKLLEHGYIKNMEFVLLKKGGQEFAGELSASLVLDPSGRPTSIVVVARDITERKEMEEKLVESGARFRDLFESIQDPVGIFVGREGRLIDYNTAFKRSSGYTDEELKDKAFLDFVHPDDHVMVLEKYQTKYSEEEFPLVYEIRGMNKKRESIPLELSVSTYKKKGRVIGIEVIHRHISERKKAEQTILESQKKFERLFMDNPEPAVYLDRDFRILDVNPRFTALFGYSLEEVKGRHINDVAVPKEKMEEAEMLDRKATNGIVYHDTVRKRKDGSLVPVSISAAPLIINNQLLGHIAVYKDISLLKKTERELAMMNEKLRVVGDLTRHDVRNKLSAITGNAYLAKKELTSDSKVLEYLDEMETAAQQMVRIFDFAKAYEMLGAEELVYVDVEKTVNEAISLFSDLKDVKVTNDCYGLIVLADSLLRQLFYNLIDNSLKYGHKNTKIRIHYEKTGNDEIRLAYEDDGVGIPDAEKPKLFKEGYSTGGSTGYGLHLIKKMVEVYGWTIQETGTPGKGAQFTMTIPKTSQSGKENYRIASI
jgi:PAS domain S-box-containing protein